MCIRAIDYCPPVNITFGDFLRAVVTADLEFAPRDQSGFRVVFIESFRDWGIYPRGTSSMGWDALIWPSGRELFEDLQSHDEPFAHMPSELRPKMKDFLKDAADQWNLETDRYAVWQEFDKARSKLWKWLRDGDSFGRDYARLFGLIIDENKAPRTVYR